jgi:hypothetical protein
MTDISMIAAPVPSDSVAQPWEMDGDLDLSCILNEIFQDFPDIEIEGVIADHVQSCDEIKKIEKSETLMASSISTPNDVVPRQVSACSLVSDDEMSQNNLSKSATQESASDDEDSVQKIKTDDSKAAPQPVSSTSCPTTSSFSSPVNKKRCASEMETGTVPGESKQKVQRR